MCTVSMKVQGIRVIIYDSTGLLYIVPTLFKWISSKPKKYS